MHTCTICVRVRVCILDLAAPAVDGGEASMAGAVPSSYMLQQPMQMAVLLDALAASTNCNTFVQVHMPPMAGGMPGQLQQPMPPPMMPMQM